MSPSPPSIVWKLEPRTSASASSRSSTPWPPLPPIGMNRPGRDSPWARVHHGQGVSAAARLGRGGDHRAVAADQAAVGEHDARVSGDLDAVGGLADDGQGAEARALHDQLPHLAEGNRLERAKERVLDAVVDLRAAGHAVHREGVELDVGQIEALGSVDLDRRDPRPRLGRVAQEAQAFGELRSAVDPRLDQQRIAGQGGVDRELQVGEVRRPVVVDGPLGLGDAPRNELRVAAMVAAEKDERITRSSGSEVEGSHPASVPGQLSTPEGAARPDRVLGDGSRGSLAWHRLAPAESLVRPEGRA
jgi:hypothetical protein